MSEASIKTKLKNPLQLDKMSREELIDYIDRLHWYLKTYQAIVDIAEARNLHIE